MISAAFCWRGVSEKPLHSAAISRLRNRCQLMPLRPATKETVSIRRLCSRPRRLCASRSTLELKPPQKPRSLVRIATAARVGVSHRTGQRVVDCSDRLTTASTARVSSLA